MAPQSTTTRRLQLQTLLENLMKEVTGNTKANVYFQPPENLKLEYPAIVYNRDRVNTEHAGNFPYLQTKRYAVTVIDRDPDSLIPDAIAKLPMCSFSRHFKADNLNHDVYSLYF